MNKPDGWVKARFTGLIEINNGEPVVAFRRDGRIDFWRKPNEGFDAALREGDTNKKTAACWLASIEKY